MSKGILNADWERGALGSYARRAYAAKLVKTGLSTPLNPASRSFEISVINFDILTENIENMRILATRLKVPHAGATPVADVFGIRCIGVVGAQGQQPLILVADTDENDGTSAISAIGALLSELARDWTTFPVRDAIVIELDSMGYFDLVVPHWHGRSSCSIEFAPLRHYPAQPRSKEAFEMLFGPVARAALARLE